MSVSGHQDTQKDECVGRTGQGPPASPGGGGRRPAGPEAAPHPEPASHPARCGLQAETPSRGCEAISGTRGGGGGLWRSLECPSVAGQRLRPPPAPPGEATRPPSGALALVSVRRPTRAAEEKEALGGPACWAGWGRGPWPPSQERPASSGGAPRPGTSLGGLPGPPS